MVHTLRSDLDRQAVSLKIDTMVSTQLVPSIKRSAVGTRDTYETVLKSFANVSISSPKQCKFPIKTLLLE